MGLCLIVCFVGIFDRDLWTPDEPRVAAISLEMERSGDYLSPRLAGEPFIEKPPLYFATAAALVKILDPLTGTIGAIRLSSALFAIATLIITYLLARRLGGDSWAMPAVIVLATMAGFVENSHWIRVDSALSFFVVAAIWSFSEGNMGNRLWFFALAGLFSAGAFLVKGFIGPVMIAIGWMGAVCPWLYANLRRSRKPQWHLLHHAFCLAVFLIAAGTWMLLYRQTAGKELWDLWFWENQIGRFLGTTTEFSHLQPGKPHYYFGSLAMYALQWTPLLIVWVGVVIQNLRKEKSLPAHRIFLLVWGFGTIAFLTLAVTKRSIYLLPALPAFALMAADVIENGPPRLCRGFLWGWMILCTTVLCILAVFPVISGLLDGMLPAAAGAFMASFSIHSIIAGIGALACFFLLFKAGRVSIAARVAAATALVFVAAFAGPIKAVDLEKSMQRTMQDFYRQIPADAKPSIAGMDFDETMRGYFYFYCDWSIPQITAPERLHKIVAGLDSNFNSVIIPYKRMSYLEQLDLPYEILAESTPSHTNRKRKVYWIKGAPSR